MQAGGQKETEDYLSWVLAAVVVVLLVLCLVLTFALATTAVTLVLSNPFCPLNGTRLC